MGTVEPSTVAEGKSTFFSTTLITARNSNFTGMSKVKRSIGDIFKPYSVTSIGDTANTNYKRMNTNFRTIHVAESKLAHAQSTLSDNFSSSKNMK